jgi:hypothetical protein
MLAQILGTAAFKIKKKNLEAQLGRRIRVFAHDLKNVLRLSVGFGNICELQKILSFKYYIQIKIN